MITYILAGFGVVVAMYAISLLMMYFKQSSYMYEPDRNVDATPGSINVSYDDVRIKRDDGELIAGWYIPAFGATGRDGDELLAGSQNPLAGSTVLVCHGNAGNISYRLDLIMTFHKLNMNVFIFDYCGFGDSSGKASEQGTYSDALAAWKYLTVAKGVDPESILVYGRSLGGAVATWLAAEVKAPALVLEATFTSAIDMAKERFPLLPAKLFCKYKYPSIDVLKTVRCPVVVAHCKDDTVIPYGMGQRLFEVATKPKLFIELNAQHASGLEVDIEYRRTLRKFLISHFMHEGI